jgi:hypothetical protein
MQMEMIVMLKMLLHDFRGGTGMRREKKKLQF